MAVCDICAGQHLERSVDSYVISSGARKVTVDLCSVHAKPLEALLPKREKNARKRRDPWEGAPPPLR